MALNALAIDIMLPGLQQIGASLGVENENHRQYVISAYISGFGAGAAGLRPGVGPFRPPRAAALRPGDLRRGGAGGGLRAELRRPARAALHPGHRRGVDARHRRVGRSATCSAAARMAEVMSLVFMVFMVIPVIAPGVGQLVMLFSEWHMIFLFMAAIAPVDHHLDRGPAAGDAASGISPAVHRQVGHGRLRASCSPTASRSATRWPPRSCSGRCSASSTRPSRSMSASIGLGVWFPIAFACMAGMMAVSSFVNSQLVGRFGMRRLSHGSIARLLRRSTRSDVHPVAVRPGAAADLLPAVHARDGAVRLDRLELQFDRAWSRSAMSPARHRSVHRLHADDRRRHHRRRHRPGFRRHASGRSPAASARCRCWRC